MNNQQVVKVQFNQMMGNRLLNVYPCDLCVHEYRNGRTCLELYANQDTEILTEGEPVAVCTCNIPDVQLNDGEVIIKDYAENEGMLKSLITAGVVSAPIRYVEHGFVKSPICKLLL